MEVYEGMLDLKIATPQVILNYANFCQENDRYEDSFRVFERGVHMFQFPYSYNLWVTYLSRFVERYGSANIERTRDLFEQAVEKAPSDTCHVFFLLYADFEEKFGLARRAMYVYDRATRAVTDDNKNTIFQIYIGRARELFGVTKTREIYEKAIEVLPTPQIADMCLKYANLETTVGEIDRARAIYTHGSQYSDPRARADYWKKWHDFEVRHGNEDTFAEMMRIKRSVAAQYSTNLSLGLDTSTPASIADVVTGAGTKRPLDEMQALEREKERERERASKRLRSDGPTVAPPPPPPSLLHDSGEREKERERERGRGGEEGEDDDEAELEQLKVPKAVFGGLVGK